jgi:hypothetical protein
MKAISVEQILILWQRKGITLKRFNSEFEKLITSDINLDNFNENKIKSSFYYNDQNIKIDSLFHNDNCHNNNEYSNNINADVKSSLEFEEIIKEELIINFQPLEDYSNCFQKLKLFVEQADFSNNFPLDKN